MIQWESYNGFCFQQRDFTITERILSLLFMWEERKCFNMWPRPARHVTCVIWRAGDCGHVLYVTSRTLHLASTFSHWASLACPTPSDDREVIQALNEWRLILRDIIKTLTTSMREGVLTPRYWQVIHVVRDTQEVIFITTASVWTTDMWTPIAICSPWHHGQALMKMLPVTEYLF